MFEGKICPTKLNQSVLYQNILGMNLFLPSFGINYFSAFYRKKQKKRWFNSIINSLDMNLSKLQEVVEDRGAWLTVVHKVSKNWT